MLVSDGLSHKQLRQALRQRRRALSPQQQQYAAKKLALRLIRHPLFIKCKKIAFYQAIDGEINPQYLLHLALARGKHCYLPVLRRFPKSQLGFVRIHANTRLYRHRWGIKEPRQQHKRRINQLDMVCMPLVGFDRYGHRLGMGGGFYDRSLANCHQRVIKLGLAHDCQEVDRLIPQPWDIAINAIATPTKQQWFKTTKNVIDG